MTTSVKPLEAHRPQQWGILRRLLRNFSGSIGLFLVTTYAIIALVGALGLTPYPPNEQYARERLKAPTATHIMGTDLFGRDLASRVVTGAANSLRVALTSVAIAGFLGTALGITAGFAGGLLDNLLMRLIDIFFAFPALLLALVIVTVLGVGMESAIIAISIVYTPIFARVARAPVLAIKQTEFVVAAQCIGASPLRVLLRHILPNIIAPLIVQLSLALSWSLLTEASLSFLGLGTIPPTASWGAMLNEHRPLAESAPWLILYPGLAIALSVLGFNLLGDGLRDVLDPRLRGRN